MRYGYPLHDEPLACRALCTSCWGVNERCVVRPHFVRLMRPVCQESTVCRHKLDATLRGRSQACHTMHLPTKSLTPCTPPRCHHHKHVQRSTTSSFLTHPTSLALIASPVWRLLHTHSGAKMFAAITRAKLFAPIMHYHVVEGERTRPGVSNNGLTHAPAECGRAWTWPAFCVAKPHEHGRNIEARRRPGRIGVAMRPCNILPRQLFSCRRTRSYLPAVHAGSNRWLAPSCENVFFRVLSVLCCAVL